MGWAAGQQVCDRIWNAIREHIPYDSYREVALEIFCALQDEDCDTLDHSELFKTLFEHKLSDDKSYDLFRLKKSFKRKSETLTWGEDPLEILRGQ